MNLVFILLTILWLLEFLIFPSLKKEEKSEKKTFNLILTSILFIIIVNAWMYFRGILLLENLTLKFLALILYATGLALRYWSLILLGKNFSRDVEVSENQNLVSHGSYKYIRHPLYLGLFLLTISVPLYVGNILIFFLAIIIMFLAINIRINEEERFMEDNLGTRYLEWKNKRYKLIPFIY